MITAKDIELHTPANANHEWAETNYFGFYIAEERLLGSIYTVARAGAHSCVSDIVIYSGLSEDRMSVLHFDVQQHLPMPKSFLDYKLPNGLHVKAVNPPRDYRIDYVSRCGTELHLDLVGLMDPFDIHDAHTNVRAHASQAEQEAHSGFGAGYRGHFDQTTHVTGVLKIGSRRLGIDCVDTMDHSWGPRPEYGMHSLCWMHAHFGKDLAVHLILHFHTNAALGEQYSLAHGYVLRDGTVYPVTQARVIPDRIGRLGVAMTLDVVDSSGAKLSCTGGAVAGAPWNCYSVLHLSNTLFQWTSAGGRVGYGVVQDAYPIDAQAALNVKARFG